MISNPFLSFFKFCLKIGRETLYVHIRNRNYGVHYGYVKIVCLNSNQYLNENIDGICPLKFPSLFRLSKVYPILNHFWIVRRKTCKVKEESLSDLQRRVATSSLCMRFLHRIAFLNYLHWFIYMSMETIVSTV